MYAWDICLNYPDLNCSWFHDLKYYFYHFLGEICCVFMFQGVIHLDIQVKNFQQCDNLDNTILSLNFFVPDTLYHALIFTQWKCPYNIVRMLINVQLITMRNEVLQNFQTNSALVKTRNCRTLRVQMDWTMNESLPK